MAETKLDGEQIWESHKQSQFHLGITKQPIQIKKAVLKMFQILIVNFEFYN